MILEQAGHENSRMTDEIHESSHVTFLLFVSLYLFTYQDLLSLYLHHDCALFDTSRRIQCMPLYLLPNYLPGLFLICLSTDITTSLYSIPHR